MPNWCNNSLRAPRKILEKYIDNEIDFNFNLIIPMPAHQPDPNKPNLFNAGADIGIKESTKFGRNNWYDWSCAHWGTKWNACNTLLNLEENEVAFDTAWAPPDPIFHKLCEMYPDEEMSLEYTEGGMGFAGILTNVNGSVSETDLSWHYTVDLDKCPNCGCDTMYTQHGTSKFVLKTCEDCEYQVALDSSGTLLEEGNEGSIYRKLIEKGIA